MTLGNDLRTERDFRAGDIRHTLADITQAKTVLGYSPTVDLQDGLERFVKWYIDEKK